MLLLLFVISANAAAATCKNPRAITENPADLAIVDVYDADTSCVKATNQQMRAKWAADEYDLAGFDCDHIVDVKNVPGFADGCGRDIAANKILAISWWNRALGSMCWDQVVAEKRRVYGDTIVDTALAAVRRCCETAPPALETTNGVALAASLAVIGGLAVILVISLIVAHMCCGVCARPRLAPVVA